MVVAFVSVLVLFHYKLLSNALALSIEHLLFVVSFMIWMLFVEKTKQRRILMQISYKNNNNEPSKNTLQLLHKFTCPERLPPLQDFHKRDRWDPLGGCPFRRLACPK